MPEEALQEAMRFMDDVFPAEEEEQAKKVAKLFAAHVSVAVASRDMLSAQKRHNYVTPTNYLRCQGLPWATGREDR